MGGAETQMPNPNPSEQEEKPEPGREAPEPTKARASDKCRAELALSGSQKLSCPPNRSMSDQQVPPRLDPNAKSSLSDN